MNISSSADVPSPPRDLTPGDLTESARITWKAPEKDGGSPVLHYNMEWKENKKQSWTSCEPSSEPVWEVSGLTFDREYVFRVNAQNEVGCSEWTTSRPVRSVCPYGVPGAPEAPSAKLQENGSVLVTWSPPLEDGGSPILRYVVERRLATSQRWTEVSPKDLSDTEMVVTDVSPPNEYIFRIAAVNKAGQGPFSKPSQPLKVKKQGELS